ncbi:hypothetical protein PPROV_000534400 [Pycnococcus provasolii]|uniref:Sialidase domain-containing protein n=1 Tax=Pycnococcus provasolii TaxID=41880 RepID=A0A830HN88_9CHLO|nr:hypothetical protein PPROV_000534400 [Pycnococcus provasolii]
MVGMPMPMANVEQTEWASHARGSMKYTHMPTIAVAKHQGNWRVVVAWQASSSVEGGNDQEIFVTSSDLSLRTWRAPRRLPGTAKGARWAPCTHQFKNQDVLHMFFAESRRCYKCASASSCPAPPNGAPNARRPANGQPWRAGGDLRVATSKDAGLTWTVSQTPLLTEASQGNRPKVLANGPVELRGSNGTRWVLPFWRQPPRGSGRTFCKTAAGGGVRGPETHGVLVSDDEGTSWRSYGAIEQRRIPIRSLPRPDAGDRVVEGALVAGDAKDVFMLFRTTRNKIYRSQASGDGTRWSTPESTRLHNPGSKVSALRAPGGDVLIVHNDHPWRAPRTRTDLTLTVSHDGARRHFQSLIRFETRRGLGAMFHYPSLVMHPDDCTSVFVVYGEFGKGIRVRRVRLRYSG